MATLTVTNISPQTPGPLVVWLESKLPGNIANNAYDTNQPDVAGYTHTALWKSLRIRGKREHRFDARLDQRLEKL